MLCLARLLVFFSLIFKFVDPYPLIFYSDLRTLRPLPDLALSR
jgi:hypothetical protein